MPVDTEQAKEIARQEQFWFTATTLGFVGFVGSLLKTTSFRIAVLAVSLIVILCVFSLYLIVDRHKHYREQNGESVRGWWHGLALACGERSGTLYCVVVVFFAGIGFTTIIFARFLAACH